MKLEDFFTTKSPIHSAESSVGQGGRKKKTTKKEERQPRRSSARGESKHSAEQVVTDRATDGDQTQQTAPKKITQRAQQKQNKINQAEAEKQRKDRRNNPTPRFGNSAIVSFDRIDCSGLDAEEEESWEPNNEHENFVTFALNQDSKINPYNEESSSDWPSWDESPGKVDFETDRYCLRDENGNYDCDITTIDQLYDCYNQLSSNQILKRTVDHHVARRLVRGIISYMCQVCIHGQLSRQERHICLSIRGEFSVHDMFDEQTLEEFELWTKRNVKWDVPDEILVILKCFKRFNEYSSVPVHEHLANLLEPLEPAKMHPDLAMLLIGMPIRFEHSLRNIVSEKITYEQQNNIDITRNNKEFKQFFENYKEYVAFQDEDCLDHLLKRPLLLSGSTGLEYFGVYVVKVCGAVDQYNNSTVRIIKRTEKFNDFLHGQVQRVLSAEDTRHSDLMALAMECAMLVQMLTVYSSQPLSDLFKVEVIVVHPSLPNVCTISISVSTLKGDPVARNVQNAIVLLARYFAQTKGTNRTIDEMFAN